MRTTRIMVVLLLMCFMFVGVSLVKADETYTVTGKGVILHKKGSDEVEVNGVIKNLVRGKEEKGKKPGRKDLEEMLDKIEDKEDGVVSTHYNETCYWRWNGHEWKKYCY